MHHVVIGAGPAGVIAAETLRKADAGSSVTLVGDEPEPPYSRMALPYYLCRNIDEAGTYLRKSEGHFERAGIEVRQDRVAGVDAGARRLSLEGGGTLDYDRLLVASGSRPLVPPIPGTDREGVHTCWTLADGRAIAARATTGNEVVLLGAGFIGSIILEALAASGASLTVVEMGDRMVPRMMNDMAGGLLKRWCEAKGVRVLTSTQAAGIDEGAAGKPLGVRLATGETLPADLVVTATGVTPNTEYLAGSGVDIDAGVVVDDRLRTTDPNIYAAGDVAQGKDFCTGGYTVQAIQPTAADHGRVAALNMAGRDTPHQGSVNMNVLDTMGLISASFGEWMGVTDGDQAELCDEGRFRYINLQFQDDVLVGASSLGLTENVGVLRGLIQSRTRLGPWKKALQTDPTRIMEAYLGSRQTVGANAGIIG